MQVIRSLLQFYTIIRTHPLAKDNQWSVIKRLIKFQLASTFIPYPFVLPLYGEVNHLVKREWYSARSNYIFGLYDFKEMGFLLHFLRLKDTFIEVGANTGVYSLLASGVVGANSIAIEPVPESFRILQDNIKLNNLQYLTTPVHKAIGAKKRKVSLKRGETILSHFISTKKDDTGDNVFMETLDTICNKLHPTLLLVDVVRHAHEVLKGARYTLQKKSLKAVLIRDVNLTLKNGYNPSEIHEILIDAGYSLFEYSPQNREFRQKKFQINGFHLYLKDIHLVKSRIQGATPFNISGKNY